MTADTADFTAQNLWGSPLRRLKKENTKELSGKCLTISKKLK
jgi:hypothetical protein